MALLDRTAQDIRYGFRSLVRARTLTLAALLTLALGIGANSAIFTVVNSVLLRPLPYKDSDQLVAVFLNEVNLGEKRNPASPGEFLEWQRQSRTLAHMTAARPWSPAVLGLDRPDRINGLKTSASLFDLLGVQPMLGRTFQPDEGEPGRENVMVLGHALWQRRFGADSAAIGKKISLDGKTFLVIGVMPREFRFPPFWNTRAEFWVPLALTSEDKNNFGARMLRVFARMKPGATLGQAQAEMHAINLQLRQSRGEPSDALDVNVEPLLEPVVSKTRPALLLLLGTVGFVLLIACANVSSLLLAKALGRQREIAVRVALGAGRMRLLRQFLTESLLLGLLGGTLGIGVAAAGIRALVTLSPQNLPRLNEITFHPTVLWFTFALAVGSSCLFGMVPAWQASRPDVNDVLKAGGRQAGGTQATVRNLLVVIEVALALVLLAGAGLLLRSYWNIRGLDPGFSRENVLTATLTFSGSRYTGAQQDQFHRLLQSRLQALPQVRAAGFISFLHIGGDLWNTRFQVEGREARKEEEAPRASFKVVTPGFFAAAGTPILRGRNFSAQDTASSPQVVIINERLASQQWSGQNPIGRRIRTGMTEGWQTVAGVVADVRQENLTEPARAEIYFPYSQNPVPWWTQATLVVSGTGAIEPWTQAVQSEVWALDPNLPVSDVRTLENILDRELAQPRFDSALILMFAAVALVLSVIGIYGVLNYSVSQRMKEIGLRAALGAQPRQVLGLVMGSGLKLTLTGVGIGLVGALALTRLMQGMLYGVEPADPATLLVVSALLTFVGLAASYLPARRALRVDPMIALRNE